VDIQYHQGFDRLYIRFDLRPQTLTNVRVSESIVLDMGADDRIVGIEILDASKTVNLASILPVHVEAGRPAPA